MGFSVAQYIVGCQDGGVAAAGSIALMVRDVRAWLIVGDTDVVVIICTVGTYDKSRLYQLALHLEHLTGWSLTRLISLGDLCLRVFFRLLFGMGFLAVERN
jgi:hypothetical protein